MSKVIPFQYSLNDTLLHIALAQKDIYAQMPKPIYWYHRCPLQGKQTKKMVRGFPCPCGVQSPAGGPYDDA